MIEFFIFLGLGGGLIPILVALLLIRNKRKRLNEKFISLGSLIGRTYTEIVLYCGSPETNMMRRDSYGNIIRECEWRDYEFRITLFFDKDGYCISIGNQTSGYY